MRPATIVVMAKAPVAGLVKTRLCPPCTPQEAATLARAALLDTLVAVAGAKVGRRLLALDGRQGDWLPAGIEVVAQRGNGLADRLAHAVANAPRGAVLVIGMDTPQVTSALLDKALSALEYADAALGAATDGGWWALAMRAAYSGVFDGVAMSAPTTGADQLRRLRDLGLHTTALKSLTDVDTYADAQDVAATIPHSHFARALEFVVPQGISA